MRKVGKIGIELELTIWYYTLFITLYPTSWIRRLLLVKSIVSYQDGWHFLMGPFHIWSMGKIDSMFRIGFNVDRDPFWGTAISVPPSNKAIFDFGKKN